MTGPALSNYLSVLAVEVAGEVAAFKRSSTAAHVAYLAAGAKLVEARAHARRGEWGAFLARCGIEARTARDMMACARAGLTPDDLTAAGGVRGALEALRAAAVRAVEGAAALDAGEKTATVAAIASPAEASNPPEIEGIAGANGAGRPALAQESGLAPGELRSVQAGAPPAGAIPHRSALQERQAADSAADGDPTLESGPARGPTLYQWRRAMGLCTSCGEPSGGAARCPGCARALAGRRARAAELARIGRDLAPRIEAARRAGRGVRLTAAEVARLVSGW